MTGVRQRRDHGGGLDAAIERWGGKRSEWIDLSTGINPVPYPLPKLLQDDWTALPDHYAIGDLLQAARAFWQVPNGADILAAPGASALIARIPALFTRGDVQIPHPTYNEHAAAFSNHGWKIVDRSDQARVVVHPNNPDGHVWTLETNGHPLVIDESFCDVIPEASHISFSEAPNVIVLKSFGKFWGLAGLRLGFAIASPDIISRLAELLGPWPVAGPALRIGTAALQDKHWSEMTRLRLVRDAARLDEIVGWQIIGGTPLFRLYNVTNAFHIHNKLAEAKILTRIFPYSDHWIRLGLHKSQQDLDRLSEALR